MRHNGYDLTPYKAGIEREDGSYFEVRWVDATMPATFNDPSESLDDEFHYFLDDVEIDESDIPEEVTEDVLDRLKSNPQYNDSWRFGAD